MSAGNFASFINGLGGGITLYDRYTSLRDREETAKGLKEVASATPETSQGFTADQGEDLRRAAESGQYDIGWDEASKAYTVTPKADPSQAGKVGLQNVTDFLGNRTAGTMTERETDVARQRKMADVIGRTDPAKGLSLRNAATTAEREDQRFGWEKQRAEREGRKFAEEEQTSKFKKGLETEVGKFMQSRLAGPDGQTRPATHDDYLAASEFKTAKLIENGKMEDAAEAMKEHNAQAFIKIKLETAERDKALGETIAAVNSGNLDAARQFYDRFLPDGAQITDVKQDQSGRIIVERLSATGQPVPPMTFNDVNQMTASLSALKDPMAVYNWSQSEFKNNLAVRADARAERADNRASLRSAREEAGGSKPLNSMDRMLIDGRRSEALKELRRLEDAIESDLSLSEASLVGEKSKHWPKLQAHQKRIEEARAEYQRWNSAMDELATGALDRRGLGSAAPGAAPKAGPAAGGGPVKVDSKAAYESLPKGTRYTAPDGSVRIKQ